MNITVYGTIYLVNGKVARVGGGARAVNGTTMIGSNAKFTIDKGKVKIEYDSNVEREASKPNGDFWLYHISKDLINNHLFSEELKSNECLIFLPEYSQKERGAKFKFQWNISDRIAKDVDQISVIGMMGENPEFRASANDFHMGLLDTTNSPSHFYRAVDTLGQFVMKVDRKLEKAEWIEFKKRIDLSEKEIEELKFLTELAEEYRHGNRKRLIDNYVRLLQISKIIIIKTYYYYERNKKGESSGERSEPS